MTRDSETELHIYGTTKRETISPRNPEEGETNYQGISYPDVPNKATKSEREITTPNTPKDAWNIDESELEFQEEIGRGGFY